MSEGAKPELAAHIEYGLTAFDPIPGAFFTTTDPETFIHFCARCAKGMSFQVGARGAGHQLLSRDPLTIQGSIICPRGCGAHYCVTKGAIAWLADDVPLP